MNRFISSLGLLIIATSVLMRLIDLGLGAVAASPRTSQLTIYNASGAPTQIYTGSFDHLVALSRVDVSTLPHLLRHHRTPVLAVQDETPPWL